MKKINKINYEYLKQIGFNKSHLIQIYRTYEKNPELELPFDIIQESIEAISFDIENNALKKNITTSPIIILLSLLKKGIPYSSKIPEFFFQSRNK
jgi:hypothetical protein